METVNIPIELYNKLNYLGLIPNDVRQGNVGKSDYSKRTIQPWSIWLDYQLNPWDADIVKRVLRTKDEAGMTPEEAVDKVAQRYHLHPEGNAYKYLLKRSKEEY